MIYFGADLMMIFNEDADGFNAGLDYLPESHLYSPSVGVINPPKSGEIITYSTTFSGDSITMNTGIFLCLDTQEKVDIINKAWDLGDSHIKLGDNVIICDDGCIEYGLVGELGSWIPAVKTKEEALDLLMRCFSAAIDHCFKGEDFDENDFKIYLSYGTIKSLEFVELFDAEDPAEEEAFLKAFPEIRDLKARANAEKKESTLCFDSCSPEDINPEIREILEKILKKIPEFCRIHISGKQRLSLILNFKDLPFINLIDPSKWSPEVKKRLKPALLEIFKLKRLWGDLFKN